MKVLLILALAAIVYSLFLSRSKAFIAKSQEEYKGRQKKIKRKIKKRRPRSRKSSKRRKSKRRKRKR